MYPYVLYKYTIIQKTPFEHLTHNKFIYFSFFRPKEKGSSSESSNDAEPATYYGERGENLSPAAGVFYGKKKKKTFPQIS